MGKIEGWRKHKNRERHQAWKSIKGNVITVENPPRGWVTYISTEKGEKSYIYAVRISATNHAIRYMKSHPRG